MHVALGGELHDCNFRNSSEDRGQTPTLVCITVPVACGYLEKVRPQRTTVSFLYSPNIQTPRPRPRPIDYHAALR